MARCACVRESEYHWLVFRNFVSPDDGVAHEFGHGEAELGVVGGRHHLVPAIRSIPPPMGVNSISFGSPRVCPMGCTCGA